MDAERVGDPRADRGAGGRQGRREIGGGMGWSWALAALVLLAAVPTRADLVLDSTGDTLGAGLVQHDIVSIQSTLTATQVVFEVVFADAVFAPSASFPDNARSVLGYIDLDVDGSASTG